MLRRRTRLQKVKEVLWPSMGWKRVLVYYRHRMGRLSGTPYFIAAGFAAGVAVSFTPFIGFHLMSGALVAWLLDGSLVAMALGTLAAGNPWTFPFIWVLTYKLGKWMMGFETAHAAPELAQHFTFSSLLEKPFELLLPMTLGSVPFAIVFGFASFYAVRHIVKGHRETRQQRIYKK